MKKRNTQFANFLFILLSPLLGICNAEICKDVPPLYSLQSSDKLQFGRLWKQIKRLEDDDLLYGMIRERRKEIQEIKNHWKAKIPSIESAAVQIELEKLLKTGSLSSTQYGCGAAYFLCDQKGDPIYIVKPIDEDILCLNNRKHFASPYNDKIFRVRDGIPLYRTAQAEALAYIFAKHLGFEHLTPTTYLAVLRHDAFFDLIDNVEENSPELKEEMGQADREKLCSVQTYIPDIVNLYDFVENCLKENLSDKQVHNLIDSESFENLSLLIWLLFDTDAHAGNLYMRKQEDGKYTLLKIDNGLTFPDTNKHLLNALYFFPHAKLPPSKRLCNIIQNLPIKEMLESMHLYEMDEAKESFLERVEVLQKLTQDPVYTLRDIDTRLHALELPEGDKIALSEHLSIEEIQKLISYP